MIELFSIEFWICIQLFVDLVFAALLFIFVKRVGKALKNRPEAEDLSFGSDPGSKLRSKLDSYPAEKAAEEIIGLLEPLVAEAERAAKIFDGQIKEKKKLINGVNDALDSRIISINLLLSRAEALYRSQKESSPLEACQRPNDFSNAPFNPSSSSRPSDLGKKGDVFDQQKRIIDLYTQGFGIEAIASKLSMPKGEVQLVVSLKQKFVNMENQK
ncbi:MAG: hypothetical protein U9P10_10825 [Thermodesulfobacteriota bacterium]|nr:hypothetical protein [Thermodesulfobacteriota bacterium]